MRTWRSFLVGTVVALLLGALGGVAQAQLGDGVVPVLTSGTMECVNTHEGTETEVDGVGQGRGFGVECTVTQDDPRVSGTLTFERNWDCRGPLRCVGWTSDAVLTGPNGTWVGDSVGTGTWSSWASFGFFEGTGWYEGWTWAAISSGEESPEIHGIIYRGEVPRWWQPSDGSSPG
jgi:hypothetical protein